MEKSFTHPSYALVLAALVTTPVSATETGSEAIVVTATRQPTRLNDVLADVTLLDREAIEQAGQTTLPELLSRQAGLHVITNGGLGKSASVFIRGANSGQTLLLVDGVRLGDATLGIPKLDSLPLSQIDRIEILRGPASSLYGSDAIGGVIQVFTRRGEGPLQPNAFVGIGPNRSRDVQAGVSGGHGSWSYSLGVSQLTTDGFNVAADPTRFQTANFGTAGNPDADGYRNNSYSAQIAYQIAQGHEIGFNAFEAKVKNFYDNNGPTVDAFNKDKTSTQGAYLRSKINDNWTSTLRWGLSEHRSETFDPARSLFGTKQSLWSWQNDMRLSVGTLLFAAENSEQKVDSTTNFATKERSVRSFIVGYQGNLGAHSWQTSVRTDSNSQYGRHDTGYLGYGYRFTEAWQVRAATSSAFRAPSFFDIDPGNSGNVSLRPEKARNQEVGINWEKGSQSAALTLYDNKITNLIQFDAGTNTMENVGKARITGSTLGYSLVHGGWNATATLDLMRPINEVNGNRLARRPSETFKLSSTYAPGPWKLGGELIAVGRRYDTATQTRPMGGYAVANIHASMIFEKNWSLEGRMNNLFDREYENVWSYAVPGREVYVGVRYSPK